MKLLRTIAMYTDHDYHGRPIETSRVELYVDEVMGKPTQEMLDAMYENQRMRLLRMAKRMPHRFWQEHPELESKGAMFDKPIDGYSLHKIRGGSNGR